MNLITAAWLTKEVKKWSSNVLILKLNGENSHTEKERVSKVFKER